MNIPSAVIEHDMGKVQSSIKMCLSSIDRYKEAKKTKRAEQQELRVLIRNPGYYNVEALKKNVERCNTHVEEYEKTIKKEKETIKSYQTVYNKLQIKLEEKKLEELENGNT